MPPCPLAGWGITNQSAAVPAACSSPDNACFLCLTALMQPIMAAGVLISDNTTQYGCLVAGTPFYVQMGASLQTMRALRACTFSTTLVPTTQARASERPPPCVSPAGGVSRPSQSSHARTLTPRRCRAQ